MNEDDLQHEDDELPEPGTIGVGMGGSCPVCRAPVDLGQEFCLECGSPIRFTPRQRRQPRPGSRPGMGAPAPAAPRRSGFPWVPFLVVLALVGGGVAFALVDGNDGSSNSGSKGSRTEPALPEITNSVPDEPDSSTLTTTLQDCDPNQPLGGTQPAVEDGTSTDPSLADPSLQDGSGGDTIPELNTDGTDSTDPTMDPFDNPDDVPSLEPSDGEGGDAGNPDDQETVTVDQNGDLCDSVDGAPDPSAPIDPADPSSTGSTDPAPTDSNPTATASGDWPSGKEGWTVIVAGYDDETRAAQAAADVQEDGFSDSGVLFSSDFVSLCSGFHVVFSGIYDSRAQALQRVSELSDKGYGGMYEREIRTTGEPAGGCTTTR